MDAKPYGILVICTGNIHRSPTAQHLLAHAFRGEPISVVSAGTAPALGEPMGGTLAEFLRGEGIDPSGFRARFLTAADVRDADLILGMTRAHRGQAVSLWPGALRRSFTLKEFARAAAQAGGPGGGASATQATDQDLAAGGPGGGASATAADETVRRLALLADLAARRRTPAAPADDDIADPHGQGDFLRTRVFGGGGCSVPVAQPLWNPPHVLCTPSGALHTCCAPPLGPSTRVVHPLWGPPHPLCTPSGALHTRCAPPMGPSTPVVHPLWDFAPLSEGVQSPIGGADRLFRRGDGAAGGRSW